MLPWAFTEDAAAEKHMAQLQHDVWVTASRTAIAAATLKPFAISAYWPGE
jgi:hypothetical protein